MNLFEKIILKDVSDFQNLTAEEKRKHLPIFKHNCLALWLSNFLLNSPISFSIALIICIIDLIVIFLVDTQFIIILFFVTMPFPAALLILNIISLYKKNIKKQTNKEINDWLTQKIENLWLLNNKVISFNDWKFIKKKNKTLYKKVRSKECNHTCYFTSYTIANTLKNPDIKILWICVETFNHKCGHSVLVKNNKIYDSNLRRTYNREKYLKSLNAEVFKEYSMDEYLNDFNIQQTYFSFLDWEEFDTWCKQRNAIRNR